VLRGADDLAILVKSQEGDIEGVAGEVEVVGIPPEEGGAEFRSEDQADI